MKNSTQNIATDEEIAFIEAMIKPMDEGGDDNRR